MGAWCRGDGHAHYVGDLRDAEQRGDRFAVAYYAADPRLYVPPLVPLDDPVETLIAIGCSCCRYHTALPMNAPRPTYKPPTDWQPDGEGGGHWRRWRSRPAPACTPRPR